jgi:hypothetical protein
MRRRDHQEAIYGDDADRELFLRCLEEACEKTGWLIQVISTYVHLNPVRAGLIRGEGEPLKAYRWSSCPAHLLPPRKRVAWLRVDRVMGSLGLGADDAPGCVGTRPPRAVGSLSV